MQIHPRQLPLAEGLHAVREAPKLKRISANEFLDALRQTKYLRVQFPQPDRPEVSLKSLRLRNVAKAILETSEQPLTPEDILAKAQAQFGAELVPWTPIYAGNRLNAIDFIGEVGVIGTYRIYELGATRFSGQAEFIYGECECPILEDPG